MLLALMLLSAVPLAFVADGGEDETVDDPQAQPEPIPAAHDTENLAVALAEDEDDAPVEEEEADPDGRVFQYVPGDAPLNLDDFTLGSDQLYLHLPTSETEVIADWNEDTGEPEIRIGAAPGEPAAVFPDLDHVPFEDIRVLVEDADTATLKNFALVPAELEALAEGDGGSSAGALLHGFDQIQIGTNDDDTLDGGEHGDTEPEGSRDLILGLDGDDTIRGGQGSDWIAGGDGDDFIDHMGNDNEYSGLEWRQFDWQTDGSEDLLSGGEGNDVIKMDRYDRAAGGSGGDVFWVHHDSGDASTDSVATIEDFDPAEDFLRVNLDPATFRPDLTIEVTSSEDGEDAHVMVAGELVAILRGAPTATPANIYAEVLDDLYPSGPITPPIL
ncbi:MAG: calcium-binding protein [Pseudomonadota bacterium]